LALGRFLVLRMRQDVAAQTARHSRLDAAAVRRAQSDEDADDLVLTAPTVRT
jgi:hypothetical protein